MNEMAAEVARGDLEPDTPAEKAAKEGEGTLSPNGAASAATIGSMKQ